ncbi:MAG: NTP transferase domain-containing protein [Caldilineaceae bacterium]
MVVVGYAREQVMEYLGDSACYAEQAEQLGTGHAVRQAASVLQGQADAVLVTYGDMPLLQAEDAQGAGGTLHTGGARAGCSHCHADHHTRRCPGFGRIIRDGQGNVAAIVEEADCTPEQRRITELNPASIALMPTWPGRHCRKSP